MSTLRVVLQKLVFRVSIGTDVVRVVQSPQDVMRVRIEAPSALGATGPAGATILYASVDPTVEGRDGDGYINTLTNTFFGPRAAGVWPAGVSLVGPAGPTGAAGAAGATGPQGPQGATGPTGPAGADGAAGAAGPAGPQGPAGADGRTVLYGTADPTTEGVDGDFYINTTSHFMFGPKATVWPAGISLIGPQGPAGADGAAGATGPQGPAGADGADGADGATGPAGPTGAAGVGFVAYGFGPRADSTLAFDDGTRTFSIAPTSANFKVWVAGTEFTKTVAQTVVIADTLGWHYIYFDATGTIQETTAKDEALFKDNAIAAAVYWTSLDNKSMSISDRRHSYLMDRGTLWAVDRMHGLKMVEWPEPSLSTDGDGSLDLHAQIGIGANAAVLADLSFNYAADAAPVQWPVFHRDNAVGDQWVKDVATDFPAKRYGTGRLAVNVYVGGWGQAEVTSGLYCWSHIFATTDPNMPYAVVQGLSEYGTEMLAVQELGNEVDALHYLNGVFYPLPFEGTLLMSVLFKTADGMTNTVKAAAQALEAVGPGNNDFFNWTIIDGRGIRSHRQLKDIGFYTHAEIDGFIGLPAVDMIVEKTLGAGVTVAGVPLNDGVIPWANVDKTGSSLADLATKAHGALSDIGTNTHAQIDTHLADTTNPHLVTSDQVLGNGAEGLLAVFGSANTVNDWVYLFESFQIALDGGGATITTGAKGFYIAPFAMTITGWTMVVDQTGSIAVDVWKDTYANRPPTVADSIVTPAISSATGAQGSSLSISVAKGDILRFNVDSATSVQMVTLALTGVRV